MTNAAKKKGTAWESAIVAFLHEHGYPYAERRSLHGTSDRGDIAGLPGVVIEAKSQATLNLPAWLRELDAEIVNDGADTGALFVKAIGKSSAADGLIVMRPAVWIALMKDAGQ